MNDILNHYRALIKRNGKIIRVNDTYNIKCVLQELSDGVKGIDTKTLISIDVLLQGDIVTYESINYMVVTKNQSTNGVYGVYTLRNCPYVAKFDIDGLNSYPMFCTAQKFDLSSPSTGGVGVVPVNTIMVTIPNTVKSNTIPIGKYLVKFNSFWLISGIDKTVEGLITFTCDYSLTFGEGYLDLINEVVWVSTNYGVSVNPTIADITLGNTLQLIATTISNGTPIEEILTNPLQYESSNTSIVTVSSTGLVTSVSKGTAIVTVWINDESNYTPEGAFLKFSTTSTITVI